MSQLPSVVGSSAAALTASLVAALGAASGEKDRTAATSTRPTGGNGEG